MESNNEIDDACDNVTLKSLTIPRLKEYLRSRGQHVSRNKAELIERVKGAHRMQLSDLNCVKNEDRKLTKDRIVEKLKTPLGESLVHPPCIDKWSVDVSSVPDISEKDIYNYFVLKLKTKRQLKAKVMYEDGHVHNIQINESEENDSHCFVRGSVIPSMPTANKKDSPDYKVWVMLSKVTGCINSAECNCTAGEGEGCNHIAALLYALADLTEKKRDGKLAPSSIKCKWNNPRKRKLSPKKPHDLTFKKYVHGRDASECKKRLPVTVYNGNTHVNIERFKEKLLKGNSNVGWLKNFKIERTDTELPKLHTINFNFHDRVNIESNELNLLFENYFSSLNMSVDDCVKIECLTRNQNNSDFWMEARQERLTASNFGAICKLKTTTAPDSMLKSIFGYIAFQTIHTKYGKQHEPAARRKYQRCMQKLHPGLTVKKCGLAVNPKFPYLGASPDGLVSCTHSDDSRGVLEVKCPSSLVWRMKTPEECANDAHFFCYLNQSNEVVLKRTHHYYYQFQGQLAMCDRKWCDFVVWTCAGISVERI